MNTLIIHTDQCHATSLFLTQSYRRLGISLDQLHQIKGQSYSLSPQFFEQIQVLVREVQLVQQKVQQIDIFVKESGYLYEQHERILIQQAEHLREQNEHKISKSMVSSEGIGRAKNVLLMKKSLQKTTGTAISSTQYGKWRYTPFDHYYDTTHNASLKRSARSLLQNGIIGTMEAGASLCTISRTDKVSGLINQAQVAIGNAEISGRVKGVLFQQKHFSPELMLNVNASVSAASGLISSMWRNEYIEVKAEAKGEVGVAGVRGNAVINKKEVTMEGEVGAAAAHGEVKGTLEFLGITITAKAEGEVGGIGVKGVFSSTDHSFEIGGKLSCLLGGGADIKIEW